MNLDTPLGQGAPKAPKLPAEEMLETAARLCDNLRASLDAKDGLLKLHLNAINEQLHEFPELTHLLSDEQIAPVYMALQQVSGLEVKVAKSKSPKSKGLLDDGSKLGDVI